MLPFSAKYFGSTIIMLATSLATTVFIISIHHKGEYGHRVPDIVRKITLQWIANLIGMKAIVKMVQIEQV